MPRRRATNVLHYTFFKDLDWAGLGGAKTVRLVIPLVVVEQLDEQTYRGANANRAKAVIRALRAALALDSPEAPSLLRPNVEVQLLGEQRGHRQRSNSNDEILDRAEHLAALVGGQVSIATGDLSMQTRAAMRGLGCLLLPDKLREHGD